jgi:hypothetical protein
VIKWAPWNNRKFVYESQKPTVLSYSELDEFSSHLYHKIFVHLSYYYPPRVCQGILSVFFFSGFQMVILCLILSTCHIYRISYARSLIILIILCYVYKQWRSFWNSELVINKNTDTGTTLYVYKYICGSNWWTSTQWNVIATTIFVNILQDPPAHPSRSVLRRLTRMPVQMFFVFGSETLMLIQA